MTETLAERLQNFAKWAIREGAFQGCDLDGGSIQEKASELGLIERTTYDPKKHGPSDCAEEGDEWFVFSSTLDAAYMRWRGVSFALDGMGYIVRAALEAALARGPVASAEADGMVLECASEGCERQGTVHFISGDVGSYYCEPCHRKIRAMIAAGEKPAAPAAHAVTDAEIYKDGHLRACRMCASDGIGQNCTCGFEEWEGAQAALSASPAPPSELVELRAEVDRLTNDRDVLAYKLEQAVSTVQPMIIARAEAAEARLSQAVEDEREACAKLIEEHAAAAAKMAAAAYYASAESAVLNVGEGLVFAIRARTTLRSIKGGE